MVISKDQLHTVGIARDMALEITSFPGLKDAWMLLLYAAEGNMVICIFLCCCVFQFFCERSLVCI